MKVLRLVPVLLFVLLALPLQAHAQWNSYDALMSNNVYSRGWVNPYNNTYTNAYSSTYNYYKPTYPNLYFSGSRATRESRRKARLKATPKRERTEAERFAKYNGTMYKPGKSTAPAKLAAIFSKNLGGKTADYQPVMVELLKLYQTQAKKQNAPATDLARTLAYCISANYYCFTGGTGVPDSQVDAMRAKLRTALSEDKKFRSLSNAQKQEMNESMVILTHFAALGFEVIAPKASSDKRALVREGYKKLAGANLQGILGVAPNRVAFDKDGLVIKGA